MAHSEYLCVLPQPILKSPASSALCFSIQDPEGLSQLDGTSLTGAPLFAFFHLSPLGSVLSWISCSVIFLPFPSDHFLPSCFYTHTCTRALHFPFFLLRSYHFEILEPASAAPRVSPKMVISKAALLNPALFNTGER